METQTASLAQWVRATWLGWGLGLIFTIAGAVVTDSIGLGEWQTLIGAAMGAGVGFVQRRKIRALVADPQSWLKSSAAGLAAPFFMFDLARLAGFSLPYSLYLSVALGGLVVGLWQRALLRPKVDNTLMWVIGTAVGWSLAAATAAIADRLPRMFSLRGLAGAGTYLAVVLVGGLILGVVTGLVLIRLKRRVLAAPYSSAAQA